LPCLHGRRKCWIFGCGFAVLGRNAVKPFSFYNRLLPDRRNFAGATFEPREQKGIDRLKVLRFDNVIDDVLRKGSIHGQKLHTFGLWVIQGG
jgi:hypothetical protein